MRKFSLFFSLAIIEKDGLLFTLFIGFDNFIAEHSKYRPNVSDTSN